MTACAVCNRETRGLYYTHLLRPDRYPTFAFCSMRCLRPAPQSPRGTEG